MPVRYFTDDFGRFLNTGRYLDTFSGHGMIHFYCKRWSLQQSHVFSMARAYR